MQTLPKEKVERLRKCYIEEAMSPAEAARKVDCSYSTALRYYTNWAPEIQKALERQILPAVTKALEEYSKE